MAAGAIGGCSVDAILFPIDSIKTRLQAKQTQSRAGKFQNVYRGLPAVMFGNSVGSAVFFATYEASKAWFHAPAGQWQAVLTDSMSAILGELVACTVRTPTEILKQRMQAQQIARIRTGLSDLRFRALTLGFRATAVRDLGFSAIQYPSYEYLKVVMSRDRAALNAWEAALCGSVTGCVTAVITTPLDVVKTRIMLASGPLEAGIAGEAAQLCRAEGLRGLFRGALCRGVWMGLGGLVFLGTYEKSKSMLYQGQLPFTSFHGGSAWSPVVDTRPTTVDAGSVHVGANLRPHDVGFVTYRRCWYGGDDRDGLSSGCGVFQALWVATAATRPKSKEAALPPDGLRSRDQQQGRVSQITIAQELLAGGVAGCTVDVALYPIDTLKTRLQAAGGIQQAGGMRGLWRGVSAPALAGVPASGVFWAVYVPLKEQLHQVTGSRSQAEILSGPISELTSLVVRVPSEVVKQRIQAGVYQENLLHVARHIHSSEGLAGFYTGFAATCLRSVPFAVVQFPVYEELKRQLDARVGGAGGAWWTGGASGALAGGIAAVVTTPLDVIKTRIMLSPADSRLSFLKMARRIVTREGSPALLAGVVPRGVYMSLGGMVYLGVYNVTVDFLRREAAARAR